MAALNPDEAVCFPAPTWSAPLPTDAHLALSTFQHMPLALVFPAPFGMFSLIASSWGLSALPVTATMNTEGLARQRPFWAGEQAERG